MSEQTYRANLSASSFPLIHDYQGRATIIPGPDQNYIRGLQAPLDGLVNENDRGVAQIQYCHNVMPSGEGFQSVGFFKQNLNAIPGGSIPDIMIPIRDAGGFGQYYDPTPLWAFCNNTARVQEYQPNPSLGTSWRNIPVTGVNDIYAGTKTWAYINGDTFIYCTGSVTPLRVAHPFNPSLDDSAIVGNPLPFLTKGITSSYGYMILWTEIAVAWSSLLVPTDFTPSLVTGAGFASIQEAKGRIILCVPHELGFLILCSDNVVSATYTGNKNNPFLFKEVSDAGGYVPIATVYPQNYVTSDTTANQYYMFNKSGIQNVGSRQAVNILPDISDFLGGTLFEDFNTATQLFSLTDVAPNRMVSSFTFVGNRYLVISYGIFPTVGNVSYTHALVYDTLNKRMGKIKFTHIIACELPAVLINGTSVVMNPAPRDRIGFVNTVGDVYSIDFDTNSTVASDSVLIVGKFQLTRQRLLQMEHIQLENVQSAGACSAYMYTSLNGKDPTTSAPVALMQNQTSANYRSWFAHKAGINHTLAFIGAFYATTIVLKFHNNGRR